MISVAVLLRRSLPPVPVSVTVTMIVDVIIMIMQRIIRVLIMLPRRPPFDRQYGGTTIPTG